MDVNCALEAEGGGLAKLSRGTAALRIENGRWSGLQREERSCGQCSLEEMENEDTSLLRCEGLRQKREFVAKCGKNRGGGGGGSDSK